MSKQKGRKQLPLSLKIILILIVLWMLGSIANASNLFNNGLPFFGLYLYGFQALLVIAILDIVAPLIFLYGVFNRKKWAPRVAFTYMGIFILNSIVALFTVREQLGIPQIIIPSIVTLIFLIVIYRSRSYFKD